MLAFALAACSDAPAPDPADAGATPPAAAEPAAPAGNAEADLAPLLDQLTQTLRKYSAEKQRVPDSLDELVATGYLPSLPQAPAGKKFVINPQRVEVILANR